MQLAERMLERGIEPSQHCYNELLQACAGSRCPEACDRCLRLLQGDGHAFKSGVDYNVALDAVNGTAAGNQIFLDALAAGAYGGLAHPSRRLTLDLHGLSGGAARHAHACNYNNPAENRCRK